VVNNVTVVNNTTINNTNITQSSYAGAPGTRTQPTAQEAAAVNEPHVQPTVMQVQHESAARANPELAAAHNQGHPAIAATSHPGAFTGPGVTAAKPVGAAWHPAAPPAPVNNAAHAVATNTTHGPAGYAAHPGSPTPAATPGHPLAANGHNGQHAPQQPGQQQKAKAAAKANQKKGESGKPGERPPEQRG
jgi:hypothetical protein